MTEFCQGVVNETYERYLFNTRSQGENESVDEFYSALLALSKNCSFGELTSSLIKDRVIVGIQDTSTRQRLLNEKELSLHKCLEIARSYEATKIRMKAMQDNHGDKDMVNRVRKFNKKGNRSNKGQSTFDNKCEQKGLSKKCSFCGRAFHKRQFCPAKNATCNNCSKKGHFQAVCKSSKTVRGVHVDEQSSSSDQETPFLGAVHGTESHQDKDSVAGVYQYHQLFGLCLSDYRLWQ